MTILITGGAGFIGRWVVKKLLLEGKEIVVIDNLSNSRKENLSKFKDCRTLVFKKHFNLSIAYFKVLCH